MHRAGERLRKHLHASADHWVMEHRACLHAEEHAVALEVYMGKGPLAVSLRELSVSHMCTAAQLLDFKCFNVLVRGCHSLVWVFVTI